MLERFRDRRGAGKPEKVTARVFLGAFGKHPGWDDHIDDIGLETEVLVDIKRVLYSDGIRALVDAGDWQQLDESQRTLGFDHLFIRLSGRDCVVGRMWSSKDGKGRSLYPMVVAAHCRDLPVEWVLANLPAVLAQVKDDCTSTDSAKEVVAAIDFRRGQLRRKAEDVPPEARGARSVSSAATVARCPAMGLDNEGLVRVLYQLEREIPELGAHTGKTSLVLPADRSHHIRVPACGDSVAQSAQRWIGFMAGRLGDRQDVTFIFPLTGSWVDIIIGEPSARHLFSVQASAKRIPLVTDIPYTIDDEFRAKVASLIGGQAGAAASGRTPGRVPEVPAVQRGEAETPAAGEIKAVAARFGEAGRWLGRHWLVIAGVLVLAAILVGLVFFLSRSPRQEVPTVRPEAREETSFAAKDWQRLCEDYDKWLGRFLSDLKKPERRARWAEDPQLNRLLSELDTSKVVLDPREITSAAGVSLRELGRSPPDFAGDTAAAGKAAKAARAVESVSKLLAPDSWEVLKAIDSQAKDYARNGWAGPAEHLAKLVQQVDPGKASSLADAIDAVLDEGPGLGKARKTEERLLAIADSLRATEDPLLAKFREFAIGDIGRAEDMAAVQSRLDAHLKVAAKLDEFISDPNGWPLVETKLFGREPRVQALVSAPLSELTFDDWLAEARGYCRMQPDPRGRPEDWEGKVAKLEELLAGPLDADSRNRFQTRLAAARKNLEALWQRPSIEKNSDDLKADVRKLDKEIGGIREDIFSLSADKDKWYPDIRATGEIADSAAVNAAWATYRDKLLPSPAPDALSAEQFFSLRPKIDGLKAELRRIETSIPAPGGDLPRSSFEKPLLAAAASARERCLQRILASAAMLADGKFTVDGKVETAAANDYAAWLKEFGNLMGCVSAMESRVNACYMIDEKEAAGDSDTLRNLFERCTRNGVFAGEENIRKDIDGLTGRVANLLMIDGLSDRARIVALAKDAKDGQREARVAVWRKLGSLEDWPKDSGELQDELRLRQDVSDIVATIGTKQAGRAAALRAYLGLDTEGARRWRNCFARLTSRDEIEKVSGLRDRFGVREADLEPRLRFNLAMAGFRLRCLELREADQVKGALEDFIRSVDSFGPDVSKNPTARELLAELGAVASRPTEVGDMSKVGPAVAGWAVSRPKDGDAFEFKSPWPGSATRVLRFLRVRPEGAQSRLSYVCATEVSVGFFIEAIRNLGKEADILGLLPDYGAVDKRNGPRSWERERGGRMIVSEQWFFPLRPGWNPYLAGGAPGRPAPGHPVQYLSPEAALRFCMLLGCRLPSVSEWQAALASNDSYGPAPAPNLRDASWKRQYDYAVGAREDACMPDKDIFWPRGMRGKQDPAKRGDCVTDKDDNVLWFGDVGSDGGRGFHHLVGNVAEFVYEVPEAIEHIGAAPPAALHDLLVKNPDAVRVVGGSALSSPELWNVVEEGKDKPFGKAYLLDLSIIKAPSATAGYSDVGFRMAFTAPGEPLQETVSNLLDKRNWYLIPAGN